MNHTDWEEALADLRQIDEVERAVMASQVLDELADESRIAELYRLLTEPDFFVRESAAVPLARLEGANSLPALLQALQRGKEEGHDNDTLATTIVGIVESDPHAVTPILLRMLGDAASEVRASATWALGFVPSATSANALLEATADDSPSVRAAAAGSLASFGSQPAVISKLVQMLRDDDVGVRLSVVVSLGFLDDIRAEAALGTALQDSSERVRAYAAEALAKRRE